MEYESAWLSYRKAENEENQIYFSHIYIWMEDAIINRAVEEIFIAAKSMFHIVPIVHRLSTLELLPDNASGIVFKFVCDETLGMEGYHIASDKNKVLIEAKSSSGMLYGMFCFLEKIRTKTQIDTLEIVKIPSNPLRMLNHWDNIDGGIERGYSGSSFFFEDSKVLVTERTKDYARLVASTGINAVVINNVNVKDFATYLIIDKYRSEIKEIAGIFASYGIRLFLSINFAAPMELSDLTSADPLDESVRRWWKNAAKELFEQIDNFGGFLVKADSEGRPGPFTYGRTHVDGANMLAEAVKPYGGLIIWRCFVYNCQQDWRDRKTDRAKAGYDNFAHLDGQFLDNVILQIKNGPIDFQVREPVSPLFGALKKTNMILEVQIAQEYTGQQRHVCYLIPMFKEVLEYKTYCESELHCISDLVSGRTYNNQYCGMAAVANTGNDANWTGSDLAAANLYGFGRLSFDTSLSAEEIASDWINLTFGTNPVVQENILKILMMSWPAYEKYTAPLGIGFMVTPGHHYGPSVDGYEYDRWGTYHMADHLGMGVDRSTNGTGYTAQYHEPNASSFNLVETCPEKLLLFFHYVPYIYMLSNGKTLIQHIYDTHFEGVEDVEQMIHYWKYLDNLIEDKIYERVMKRLNHQLINSMEWRDVVCTYFYRKSGIPDVLNRKIY